MKKHPSQVRWRLFKRCEGEQSLILDFEFRISAFGFDLKGWELGVESWTLEAEAWIAILQS